MRFGLSTLWASETAARRQQVRIVCNLRSVAHSSQVIYILVITARCEEELWANELRQKSGSWRSSNRLQKRLTLRKKSNSGRLSRTWRRRQSGLIFGLFLI